MVDRYTAIEWANEAGMINFDGANWQCVTDQIQQIITRAQSEAIERAALLFDKPHMEYFGDDIQEQIRALKQEHSA